MTLTLVNPDQYNAADDAEHIEPNPHVWREIATSERRHPGSPSRRQPYAIYEVAQDICNDPGDNAAENHTT
jgi:hypothetical protein